MSRERTYMLPGFKCPNPVCGAKNIVFAANKNIYNHSKIILLKDVPENVSAGYILICPKCKSHLIIWDQSMSNVPLVVPN